MNATQLQFAPDEYADRLARTREAMGRYGIELLIVTDPANMNWLTGYNAWSFYVHQCVLITHTDDPMWYGRRMDTACARRTTFMDNTRIFGYDDHYVQSPDRHPMDRLAEIILDFGYDTHRVGVEKDNYYFSAAAMDSLREHLPGTQFIDATRLVNWERAVKSPRELDYMRLAARSVEGMHRRILEIAEPGMRKDHLAAEIYHAAIRSEGELAGDYPSIVPMIAAGTDAAAPHLTWDHHPLRANEGVFFEIAGACQRYHCPISRTLYFGTPPQHFLDAEKALLEGIEAGLEAARPGNTCEHIAAAFFSVLERHKLEKEGRTGYAIGLSYPPDWGEHTMSLRLGDHTVLHPGMTFHFMPGLWFNDWGIEITESILITESGVECLAQVPRKLLIKP